MKSKYASVILGINPTHNTSAAIMVGDSIVAAVQEERFSRNKNDRGLPLKSIEFCLNEAGVSGSNLTYVVLPSKDEFPFYLSALTDSTFKKPKKLIIINNIYHFVRYNILHKMCFFIPKLSYLDFWITIFLNHFVAPRLRKSYLSLLTAHCNIEAEKIIYFEHHQTHAATAYFASDFAISNRSTLVFTADGGGGDLAATVWLCKGGKMKQVSKTSIFSSLAYMYMYTTLYLGLKPVEDEYKVMGLSSYAHGDKVGALVEKLNKYLYVDKKTLSFKSIASTNVFYKFLPSMYCNQRFDVIAAAIQQFCEEKVLEWVLSGISKYKVSQAAFSGGLFANVVINKKISEIKELKGVFFAPSPGDESNCLGACYLGFGKANPNVIPKGLGNLHLGPDGKREFPTILPRVKKLGYKVTRPSNVNLAVAKLLARGEIVARFVNRMEFGARALGNRSILADAVRLEVKDEINKSIKSRDFWMPFAPSVIAEHHKRYLVNFKNIQSPFMMLAFETTKLGARDLAAAIHPYDKTARAQLVSQKNNPDYLDLLMHFYKLTGRSGVLNTSFNIHGEPIVCTPDDALSTFKKSRLRFLQLGTYLIEKPHLS